MACLSPRLTSREIFSSRFLTVSRSARTSSVVDDLDVPHRVNIPGHVDDVRVLEAAHDVDERVHLADVAEELVAQTLAVRRPLHQAGDVHELEGRRDERVDLGDLAELRQTRVRHAHHAEVGFDGAERVILRRAPCASG